MLASLSRGDLESLLVTHAVIASKILLQLARQLGRQLRDRVRAGRTTAAMKSRASRERRREPVPVVRTAGLGGDDRLHDAAARRC